MTCWRVSSGHSRHVPGRAVVSTDASRRYLGEFLHGADPEDSLRLRILKCLTEVVKERQSLRNNVDTLGRRIRAIESGPSDEANRKTIKELSDERRALRELLRTLNGQDTFGFLTDEGLLPNYAFPQEGVTLKSVIFKRRQVEEGEAEAEEDDIVVYEYPRPAAAALGEFAPRNEFYAGGRRVAIRRIDTRVSPIESWRLCPSCPYCENIDAGDRHGACPRCGDPLWGDTGQRREMLRLRLVHAATQDRQSPNHGRARRPRALVLHPSVGGRFRAELRVARLCDEHFGAALRVRVRACRDVSGDELRAHGRPGLADGLRGPCGAAQGILGVPPLRGCRRRRRRGSARTFLRRRRRWLDRGWPLSLP